MKKYSFDFYNSASLRSYNLNDTMKYQLSILDKLDPITKKHCENVANLVCRICEYKGYNWQTTIHSTMNAYLHDIGKIAIPKEILNKPSSLTDEEYNIMKTHTTKGYEICMKDIKLRPYATGALYHHERYDGKGYMHGLRGKEIPINARIIGIADAFDAMTANRVYRKKIDFDHVLNELRKGRATQFDPEFVDILLHLIDTKQIDVESLYREEEE